VILPPASTAIVDDTPAGGGAGMVLKPDVLAAAIDAVSPEGDTRPRLLMSPRGRPLTQKPAYVNWRTVPVR
jgi:tRNA (guanine-N1)-methyltransferase